MTLQEMNEAILNAKGDLRRADDVATELARLLVGRVRRVNNDWALSEIKKELRKWNPHTKVWKD